jgi:hypothetical protein
MAYGTVQSQLIVLLSRFSVQSVFLSSFSILMGLFPLAPVLPCYLSNILMRTLCEYRVYAIYDRFAC